jgi:Flp pilus assembly protein TadG
MKRTLRRRKILGRKDEQGIVVMLVAVFMLFVVGAMAALSIDVVTLYTARSEAQLAADSAALAGARVLANSGMTSDTTGGLVSSAETLAQKVAMQVATYNYVGGRNPQTSEVTVTFNNGTTTMVTNPHVTVTVQRTDLPTFFARMWGWKQITVAASATAEAYNPSGAGSFRAAATPVAPLCVKPWLLPNLAPSGTSLTGQIFDTNRGTIQATGLLGWPPSSTPTSMNMAAVPSNPAVWLYYPGDQQSFPAPTQALPSCAASLIYPYQISVAGCVQTPISCNSTAYVYNANVSVPSGLDTSEAVNCLTNATNGDEDMLIPNYPVAAPFQFVAGTDNPLVQTGAIAAGTEIMVSDSLVTVPVFDSSPFLPPPLSPPKIEPYTQVQIIGFVQLFLNPNGGPTLSDDSVNATVINMAGCGNTGMGFQTPIYGNGASPVAVRLITPP